MGGGHLSYHIVRGVDDRHCQLYCERGILTTYILFY